MPREREFKTEIWLDGPIERVFDFFSNAENLELLTPPWVNFKIVTPLPIEMRAGALIDYRLKIRGFPAKWRTLISAWEPPHRFVDEQLKGPYTQWIHEHTFEPKNGGVLVTDRVRYKVPFDFLVHRFFVQRDLDQIFAFRRQALQKMSWRANASS